MLWELTSDLCVLGLLVASHPLLWKPRCVQTVASVSQRRVGLSWESRGGTHTPPPASLVLFHATGCTWSFVVICLQRRPGRQVSLSFMTEAGVWEGWDPKGKARLRGKQTGFVSQPSKAFLSFPLKRFTALLLLHFRKESIEKDQKYGIWRG